MQFSKEPLYVQSAVLVLARFGYLRKDFFWKYLSPKSRSCKFRNWKILLATGYIEPYKRSFIGEDVFRLSRRGKRVLQNAGVNPVSAAHPLHFEHDDNAIHFALSAEKLGLIASTWTSEKVLRQSERSELSQMFGTAIEKLPDLVFEIPLANGNFRVAFEIERTRKTQSRYDALVQAYSKASQIQLVLIAYNDRSVFDSIRGSMTSLQYPSSMRPIAFCKISDLHQNFSDFPIWISGERVLFQTYIQNLRKLSGAQDLTESEYRSERGLVLGEVNGCV